MSRYWIALSFSLLLGYGQSQLGSGALNGVVLDSTGSAVPEAEVVVTSDATGLRRQLKSNNEGAFFTPVLPPGMYRVRVAKEGFQTAEQTGIEVNVGATANARVILSVGSVSETVTVTSELIVDITKTSESGLVDRQQIQDLPINGRRADQFALLIPGVTRDGRFGLLSYRGMSGVFNNFMIEGNDDNQAYFSEARGRTRIAGNMSANAIQEFQVGQSNFLAEFGRAAGGSINSVLRSGANAFHADAFWYYRDQNFNARDPLASFRPDERRQQFGGSVSGPVVKDKLFFFLNYDQQVRNFPLVTEDLSGVLTVGRPVLPANATPAQQAQFQADTRAFEAGVNFLRGRFPNGAPGNSLPRDANQWLGLAKVDYNISSRHVLSTFFNQLWASGANAIQTPLVLGNVGRNGSDDVRISSFNTRLTSTISPTQVNEFRFQWARNHEFQFGNEAPPQVFVGGFSFGRANFLERPALPDERKLQFVNNYSWITGLHAIKFGGEVQRNLDIIDNPANFGGTYNYTNALTFGRDLLGARPGNYNSYTQSFGLPGVTFGTLDYALFYQDQWKPFSRLTVNYGVRWDYQQLPLPRAFNPAVPETGQINKDLNNFGPRVGIAWDLTGKGKMVLRTGWGMYFARTPNGLLNNVLTQTGLTDLNSATVSISLLPTDPGAPQYPAILPALPSTARSSATVTRLDADFQRPRVQDFNVGIERQFWGKHVVSGSFIYTRGFNFPVAFDSNLPAPAFNRTYQLPNGQTFQVPFTGGAITNAQGQTVNVNLSRPNPAQGAIIVQRSIGESWYRAMFLEVKRRYSNGLQWTAAYTLAHAENYTGTTDGGGFGAEGAFNAGRLYDQANLEANRGTAPTDQRHRLVINGIWNVPKIDTGNAFTKAILNGYRISSIYTAESGRAFSNLVNIGQLPFTGSDGRRYNGFGGINGQGGPNFLPTVPRNGDSVDWNYRLDLRIARDFRLNERMNLEILGEAFNLMNRSNFNGWNNTIFEIVPVAANATEATPIVLRDNATYRRPSNNGSQPDGTNARRFQVSMRFRF